MKKHEIATKVAWSFIGTPYIWGGDDPSGFDCSGFLVEILKSVGKIPRGSDYTAQGLYNKFKNNTVKMPMEGCLVFWGKDDQHITHVEYCFDNGHTLGAAGGGSKTNSMKEAFEHNAYIKVRPIRSGYVKIVDPFL